MNIFEIQRDLLEIYNIIEEDGGEISPELEKQLAITRQDLTEKVKSYTEVIKLVDKDIDLIDEEIDRLKTLKATKTKSIDKLKTILLNAINLFGEINKNGTKYIDYGIGKVSIRKSKKVELNEDNINAIHDSVWNSLNYLNYQNAFDNNSSIDTQSLLDNICKELDITTGSITEDDLKNITTNIEIDKPLTDLLKEEGYQFVKYLLKYMTNFKTTNRVSKTDLKNNLINNGITKSFIGEVVNNETLTIR